MASTKQKLELANAVGEIIPLDPEICNQMIEYGLSLKDEQEIHSHFLNMLGESDATIAFLSKFMDVKKHSKLKKKKDPIPEIIPQPKKDLKNPWSKGSSGQEKPKTKEPSKPKAPKTTSDLVKEKQVDPVKDNRKTRKKNLDSLKDLESLLNTLEVSNSKDSRTVCYCNATRHPLFDIAPNCLNCGKIICSKEGLQPCSFCGNELLSVKDKKDIEKVLLQEKLELEKGQLHLKAEQKEESSKPQKHKKIVVSMNPGENLWKAQERALKEAEEDKKLQHDQAELIRKKLEEEEEQRKELDYYEKISGSNKELIEAQERLDRLLEYQETGEERTKIIDNAADYELSSTNTGNMWLSATERALKLKKQQRHLRKHEEAEQKRMGKGKRTVEMVIKDGKVNMVERYSSPQEEETEDTDIKELEGKIKTKQKEAENQMIQNVWDYESDQHRWERPVYTPSTKNPDSNNHNEILKKRVQLGSSQDQTELVASMY